MSNPTAPPNSSSPTTAQITGGVYNFNIPVLLDGQGAALQLDSSGNLKVNVIAGGGSSNVNIANVKGNPPALGNPLPVELSDGTNALGISGNPFFDNIAQWGGTVVQAATTSANDGTGANPVVRSTQRRFSQILTTTPLGANGVFNSAWFDTNQTGDVSIIATARSDQAAAANGFLIQEADDTADANFIFNITASNTLGFATGVNVVANTTTPIFAQIRRRFWRVQYTNGATLQGSFKLAVTANPVLVGNAITSAGSPANLGGGGQIVGIGGINQSSLPSDNNTAPVAFASVSNFNMLYGPNGATSPWFYQRTPTVFKTVQATASGNTPLWAPTAGKKFRLMRFILDLTSNANLAAGAVVTISFQDATTAMNIAFDVFIPTTAVTTGFGGYTSGWIDLGNGFLSAAANNSLNVNLSAAITTGNVRVTCCGTEE